MDWIAFKKKERSMTQEEFEAGFEKQVREIFVLRHEGGGRRERNGFWDEEAYFLAYVDSLSGVLYKGEGSLVWPVSDAQREKGGTLSFDDETIYRVKVRAKIQEFIPKEISELYKNQFLVVEVVEKNAGCPMLEELLAEYQKPVVLQDDMLGTLTFDKQLSSFSGTVLWGSKEISILLYADRDKKGTWTKVRNAMKTMLAEQVKWDKEIRAFAANKLTQNACEWRTSANEPTPEITEQSFADRISIQTISMTSGGLFSAYADDDDMFFGHFITVCGSLKKGIATAEIEG